MVLCKYFQQGTCRFGQYCKFEHSFGNRTKTFGGDDKNLALQVAEEVLLAERGGQWLLSCYGPFKERKSIPGMEDVSPEEVRWEMYQAQKNGTVDQIKVQFQQMCEQMRAKRDALKNPSQAVAQLLEEIQNSGTENSANKGNFAFAQPQISASNQTSSVFGQKSAFGPQSNPFGGSSFTSPQQSSSIFGKPVANTSTNVFGTKSSFGSSPMFGGGGGGGATTTGNSIFGGTQNAAPFGTAKVQPMFGAMQQQSSSIFGGATAPQSTFGQPPAFGGAQAASPFLKPQTTTQTSVFGGAATAAVAPGTNAASIFGGGVATAQPAAVPGGTPAGGIFGQAAPTAAGASAFGGAPVFGAPVGFGATQPGTGGSVFGGQSAFGGATAAAAVPSAAATPGNVFGGANTGASTFGALAQNVNAAGAATTTGGANVFEAAPNASPFGASISTAASPFGGMNTAGNSVFASSVPTSTAPTGPFGATMTPFSAAPASTFGFATSAPNTATNVFGTATTAASQSPFGGNTFVGGGGTAVNNSPFGLKTQQATGSPFGPVPTQQSSPFGVFGQSSISVMVAIIDETGYSPDDGLTDDEKAAYRANQFPEGHIPLRPPTKELR